MIHNLAMQVILEFKVIMASNVNPLEKINQTELASQLRITPQSVSLWVKNRKVPPKKVIQVEKLTGIHRTVLNPDVYPPSEYPKSDSVEGL